MQWSEKQIIRRCLKGDQKSQKALFDHFRRPMFRVCLRYAATREEAEDMLQEGFIAIFRDLAKFRSDGSLEGWMYRVLVRSALQVLRKRKGHPGFFEELSMQFAGTEMAEADKKLDAEYITDLISALPDGYRAVFNLYVIEGYKHEEIAEMLDIQSSTSKSQLHKARMWLKSRIESNFFEKA